MKNNFLTNLEHEFKITMKPASSIEKDCILSEKEFEIDSNTLPYREAIEALMYLMPGTRPHIAYEISFVSRSL